MGLLQENAAAFFEKFFWRERKTDSFYSGILILLYDEREVFSLAKLCKKLYNSG